MSTVTYIPPSDRYEEIANHHRTYAGRRPICAFCQVAWPCLVAQEIRAQLAQERLVKHEVPLEAWWFVGRQPDPPEST